MNLFLGGIAGSAVIVLSVALLFTAKDYHRLTYIGRPQSGPGNHSSSLVRVPSYIGRSDSSAGRGGQHNDFVLDLSRALGPVDAMLPHNWPSVRGFIVFPVIISKGAALCRRNLKEKMNDPNSIEAISSSIRRKKIVEMIRAGLDMDTDGRYSPGDNVPLPVIFFNGDEPGCSAKRGVDDFDYPRLTWSLPSPKYAKDHGMGWCNAIGAPTYETWMTVHDGIKKWMKLDDSHKTRSSWEHTFAANAMQYPWTSKINRAVWRGSSTGIPVTGQSLNEIPRGRLVRKSMENPALIDAAFVKLNQLFKGREVELANETILTDRMPFDDFMKFKAIIDIDGNTWSSRFPKLLCTNSVVIKVRMFLYVRMLSCLGPVWYHRQPDYRCPHLDRPRLRRVLLRPTRAHETLRSRKTGEHHRSGRLRARWKQRRRDETYRRQCKFMVQE